MSFQNNQSNIKKIHSDSKEYPLNLRFIFDPPECLYVDGTLCEEDALSIAVVGSRKCTEYGLHNAEAIGYALGSRGITVISGLARGIDSAAHRGALRAKGRTIAVLGSGLNVIYPPENKALARLIAASGALVSEYVKDTKPLRYNFPRRNRIISGFSLGVVVVEAAKKSGALITAYCALEQGREVFALPGKISSMTSVGVHQLIKEGAKLVESVDDIIDELIPLILMRDEKEKPAEDLQIKAQLSDEEKSIYSLLSTEPREVDELLGELNFSQTTLLRNLLSLQRKKLVKAHPGKLFTRC